MVSAPLRIELPAPHAGQRQVLAEARRFNALACGRRWGKSTLGIDRIVKPALEGFPTAWFSPTYKMLLESWRALQEVLEPVIISRNNAEYRLELRGGGSATMFSLDTEVSETVRGRAFKVVVVDEAALVKNLRIVWENAIRATLADQIGEAWFLSTPRGMNDFKMFFERGRDPLNAEWRSWRMPTSSNPFIRAEEIESARRDMTEASFAQEFLAEFSNFEGAVFRRIEEAIRGPVSGPEWAWGSQYCIGADWGRSHDFSVFCCMDIHKKVMVELQRSNHVDYTLQRSRLWAMYERWQPRTVVAEVNSIGQPIIEQLRREGMPVKSFATTNASKGELIEALVLAFEKRDIGILNDPVLIAELQAFQAEVLPSGMTRYAAPPGMHDDTVMALALSYWPISKPLGGYRSEILF